MYFVGNVHVRARTNTYTYYFTMGQRKTTQRKSVIVNWTFIGSSIRIKILVDRIIDELSGSLIKQELLN